MPTSPGPTCSTRLFKTHSLRESIPLLALAVMAIAGDPALAQGNPANYVSPPSSPYAHVAPDSSPE